MALERGTLVPYYLDEEAGWSLDAEGLTATIDNARSHGTQIRAMVVINPGNPTGQVLKRKCLEDIIKICHENSILLMADEVY
jgi:aspartate/methionine/tyrosine aminotransferase